MERRLPEWNPQRNDRRESRRKRARLRFKPARRNERVRSKAGGLERDERKPCVARSARWFRRRETTVDYASMRYKWVSLMSFSGRTAPPRFRQKSWQIFLNLARFDLDCGN